MRVEKEHKVILVFDRAFGERLVEMAQKNYVWIIGSPANEIAVRKYASTVRWSEGEDPLGSGVTTFESAEINEPFMENLWEHHGEYSHNPPLSEIVVIGASLTKTAADAWSEYGFIISQQERDGFTARRQPD
jgi:hypothetical protein